MVADSNTIMALICLKLNYLVGPDQVFQLNLPHVFLVLWQSLLCHLITWFSKIAGCDQDAISS